MLAKMRGPIVAHSPSYVDYRSKTNAVYYKGRMHMEGIGKGNETKT
jgi:hypothetical protein